MFGRLGLTGLFESSPSTSTDDDPSEIAPDVQKLWQTLQEVLERMDSLEQHNRMVGVESTMLQEENISIASADSDDSDVSDPDLAYHSNLDVRRKDPDVYKQLEEHAKRLKELEFALRNANGEDRLGMVENNLSHLHERVDSLTEKLSSIELVNNNFDSHLQEWNRKTAQSESTLNTIQEQMHSLTQQLSSSIESVNNDFDSRLLEWEKKAAESDSMLKTIQEQIPFYRQSIQWVQTQVDSFTQKISFIERDAKTFDSQLRDHEGKTERLKENLKTTKKNMETLTQKISSLETLESRLCDSEGKAERCAAAINNMQTEVATNKGVISTIMSCQDIMEKTAFTVGLEQGKELATQSLIRLSQSQRIRLPCPNFNRDTAFYTAPMNGTYLFYITVQQIGHGMLIVCLGSEDGYKPNVVYTYIHADWTGTKSDARSGVVILDLKKDQRVGVYVELREGQAKVEWCRFGGCLLSSPNLTAALPSL